jgi:xanthine dehydrogenase YagR molybdenum-binding subunit
MLEPIGRPLDRIDGRAKVTGRARYAAEFALQGLVYAALVQSTIARGRIAAIDSSAALAAPGVLAVITPRDAERLRLDQVAGHAPMAPYLQDDLVRYQGQHVAIVVADTLERAQAAAALVRVSYETQPAVRLMEQGLDRAYKPRNFRNGTRSPDSRRGDPEAAFAAAPVKLDRTYVTPIEHHNPMEPHAVIAAWDGDRLTLWHSTQGVAASRNVIAQLFGLRPEQVRTVSPFVGAGFGCKGTTWPHVALAVMAARRVGRPVKLVLERRQMYSSNGYRPRTIQHLRLAADAEGRLVAMMHDGLSQMSDPEIGEFTEPVALATEMLYSCPNVAVSHRLVPVDAPLPTSMRAPGKASGVFALESAIDELAYAAGTDPVEFRLRNDTARDEHADKPFSSRSLWACLEQGAERFGWSGRDPRPRAMSAGGKLVGYGVAAATYPANRSQAACQVILNADGSAVGRAATQDIGTGTYTIMTQVIADALGLPPGRVRFELGDSRFPEAPTSGGSQTAASVAPAAQAAALEIRDRLVALALADRRGLFAGATAQELVLAGGAVRLAAAPSRQLPLAELMARAGLDRIEGNGGSRPGEERREYSMHSFGAHFCEVHVDPALGEVRVARWLGAFGAGRILNAKTARSQLIGGIVYGMGMALFEETHVDAQLGRAVNANLAEYLVPVHADVPAIETLFVAEDDPHVNPLGVKGIGELPMVGAAAAVANAVYHATGTRIRELPIRPEKLLGDVGS